MVISIKVMSILISPSNFADLRLRHLLNSLFPLLRHLHVGEVSHPVEFHKECECPLLVLQRPDNSLVKVVSMAGADEDILSLNIFTLEKDGCRDCSFGDLVQSVVFRLETDLLRNLSLSNVKRGFRLIHIPFCIRRQTGELEVIKRESDALFVKVVLIDENN